VFQEARLTIFTLKNRFNHNTSSLVKAGIQARSAANGDNKTGFYPYPEARFCYPLVGKWI